MLGLFQCWGRVQQLEGKLDKTFSVVFRNGSVMLSKPMKTLIISGDNSFLLFSYYP